VDRDIPDVNAAMNILKVFLFHVRGSGRPDDLCHPNQRNLKGLAHTPQTAEVQKMLGHCWLFSGCYCVTPLQYLCATVFSIASIVALSYMLQAVLVHIPQPGPTNC
jgi:hypothetical protein